MTDEVVEAQDAEDIASQAEPTAETTPEVDTEQTVGEMAGDTQPTPRVVEEHKLIAERKARKAAERRIKELEQSIADGATHAEISEDIAEISEEFDVDPKFLQKLSDATKKELDAKYSAKFSEKEKVEKFETTFSKAYNEALERGPEFQAIANADVIKQLAQLPQNARKTVTQLIEETYGNALTGKRTIETTQPGGGKDPEPLDIKRAEKDIEYFKEVMADPKKKAAYNKHMIESGL